MTGRAVGDGPAEALAEQSVAETPSVEALFGRRRAGAAAVGDYEILAEIGRGGMGVVYLARQLSLGRLVALKMLPADLAGDEVALARFRREMRLLARCDHPNIVKVLASGTLPDGRLYYAMEYVPGCDLEQVWRELSGGRGQGDASTWAAATWAAPCSRPAARSATQTVSRPRAAADSLREPPAGRGAGRPRCRCRRCRSCRRCRTTPAATPGGWRRWCATRRWRCRRSTTRGWCIATSSRPT